MTPNPRILFVFKSTFIKKILLSLVCFLFIIILLIYGVFYWQHQKSKEYYTYLIFDQTLIQIDHLLHTDHIINDIDIKTQLNLQKINHHTIILSPTGKVISSSSKHSELSDTELKDKTNQKITLLLGKHKHDYTVYKDGELEAWKSLTDGYRMYTRISMQDGFMWNPHDKVPVIRSISLFSPLLVIIIFSLLSYIFFNRNFLLWRNLVDHINEIETTSIYKPLKLETNNELIYLQTVFNRVFFRLNKQKTHIARLEKTHEMALETLPDNVFLVDTTLQLNYANASFLSSFKINKNELHTYNLLKVVNAVHSEDRIAVHELAHNPKGITILVQAVEEKKKFDLFLLPQYDESNHLTGFSGTLHDVSRYQTRIERLQINQLDLDDRLSANEKLWAVMGHELRTPLNGMLGMIQLLAGTVADEEQQDYISTLRSSSNSMLFLLNDMLDLSKMDAGKMERVTATFDILNTCREVCDLMLGNAHNKNLELVFHADANLPRFIITDDFRLRQILLNLLGNAFKFTSTGHVALLVSKVLADSEIFEERFIKVDDMYQWLCFEISDSGPGIPEASQQQLFFFFNQANDTISRNFGGTGLGLAISKGLAEMLGGFIQLDSIVDKGTTFKVYLPIMVDNNQSVYAYPDALSNNHMCIIEPNPVNVFHLDKLLTALNTSFEIHTTLTNALLKNIAEKSLENKHVKHVMIIDYEVYKQGTVPDLLFSHPAFDTVKKILMAFQVKRSILPDTLNMFDGFVEKPLMVEKLISEVLRVHQDNDALRMSSTLPEIDIIDLSQASISSLNNQTISTNNDNVQNSDVATKKIAKPEPVSKNITILLAEDNIVNQKVATKMLEKNGYHIILAENGELAVAEMQNPEHNIKLILMDCRMPKMDGLEATKKIRSFNPKIPIVALTANDTKEDRKLCKDAGMNDFLAKPIRQDKLVAMVEQHL